MSHQSVCFNLLSLLSRSWRGTGQGEGGITKNHSPLTIMSHLIFFKRHNGRLILPARKQGHENQRGQAGYRFYFTNPYEVKKKNLEELRHSFSVLN